MVSAKQVLFGYQFAIVVGEQEAATEAFTGCRLSDGKIDIFGLTLPTQAIVNYPCVVIHHLGIEFGSGLKAAPEAIQLANVNRQSVS